MRRFLFAIALLMCITAVRAQQELLYGAYTGTGTLLSNGTSKAETYDIAMHLNNPMLIGMKIVGLKVPVKTKADISNCRAWLTSTLEVNSGTITTDIASAEFTPDGQWVDVTFAEPYVIPSEGVYAGYSMTVNSVGTSDADASKKPIMSIASSDVSAFYIHTSRTFRKWNNLSETTLASGGAPAFVVRLGGDVKTYAAVFEAPDEISTYVLVDKATTLTLPIINRGTANITSIDYELKVGDETVTRHAAISLKGTYFGRKGSLKVAMPAMSTKGTRPVEIRVTKINGTDNEDPNPVTTFSMAYLAEVPKHKPLMEEYTGTWCQWCVGGIAAMEAMNKLYPDDFVGVAFHFDDAMQITALYPNEVTSYPNSYLDRVLNVSPFGGTSGASLGIKDDWRSRADIIAPATLDLEAHWADEAQTKLAVTSTTRFVRNFDNSPYQLTYILTADGLKGTGKAWSQANGYAGSSDHADDPYLGPYTEMSGYIIGLEFNDVAIQLLTERAAAIKGSLPTAVVEDQPYEHTVTFDISENALVQDKTRLRPVAALINTLTGEVVNAQKVYVGQSSGIAISTAETTDAAAAVYDLSGRKVAGGQSDRRQLAKGLYIINGRKHAVK